MQPPCWVLWITARYAIPLDLQILTYHLAILVYNPPQIVLLAAYPDQEFALVESVAIASELSFQPQSI